MIRERDCKVLELPKILEALSAHASCEDAANKLLALTPQCDLRSAQRLMSQTGDAAMLIRRFGAPTILKVRNPEENLKRAEGEGVLTMRELLDIGEVLRNVRGLHDWAARSVDVETALDEYFQRLSPNKYLEDRINNSILTEDEMADTASPELYDIRNKIRRALSRARDTLDKMLKSPVYQKYLQENIITQRDGRYVVPVKAEARNEVKGLVHDISASGQTLFVEPMGVVEANNEVRTLQVKEKAEMERILRVLSGEVGGFAGAISLSYWALIELDQIFARAKYGFSIHGSVPALTDDCRIELYKARHPLIAADRVVPVDITLGVQFDTLVVTGPNTGGKTVALKTLGLISLMAMCGLMIPAADESRVSVFDHVLADIGDEQSIEQSLSTFSSHMTNIVQILDIADSSSLILLDELGAGTDPIEGAALATAILERLALFGSRIAATTHYAELKVYAMQRDRVQNACCEFDVETLRPTYRLLIGLPGKSNAFAISERLGIEEKVISRARALLSDESADFERVIGDLQQQLTEAQKAHDAAVADQYAAARARREIEEEQKKLRSNKDKELEEARRRAKKLVEQVQSEGDAILRELDELIAQKNREDFAQLAGAARAQMKKKFRKLKLDADPNAEAEKPPEPVQNDRPVRQGDVVMIEGYNQQGEVLSVDEKAGTAMVVAGIVKTKVDVKRLKIIGDTRTITFVGEKDRMVRGGREMKPELDLRGKSADEAIMELEQFMDSAAMCNLPMVTIIHGKGTGVLRKAIQQHLRSMKCVKKFRLGNYGEGESGVTIVELK